MTVEKIKEFKPKNLDVIRVKMNEALASIKEELGVEISIGGFRYAPTESSVKLTLLCLGDSTAEEVKTAKEREVFNTNCATLGLKESDFNKKFRDSRGDVYSIIGVALKSRKYTIKVINVKDKKECRFTHQDVSMFLKKSPVA